MSRSDTADRRFRVFCDVCNDHDQQHYPNSIVAASQAERHDKEVHDGEETADVEVVTDTAEPEIVTDGGREIAPEDDRVDPDRLPDDYTPAYIDVRGQGPVYVANYILLDSGWVSVTEWSGDRSKLPRHRVLALRDVRTERHGENYTLRVADEDKREQARADYPDRVDGLPLDEDGEVDRGEGVVTDGSGEREVRENQASGVSITAKQKRGTGTRDQDKIKIKAKGTTAEEARENMEAVLSDAEEWADELRGVQPGEADE